MCLPEVGSSYSPWKDEAYGIKRMYKVCTLIASFAIKVNTAVNYFQQTKKRAQWQTCFFHLKKYIRVVLIDTLVPASFHN